MPAWNQGRATRLPSERLLLPVVLILVSVAAGLMVVQGIGWIVLAVVAAAAAATLRAEYKLALAFLVIYFPFSPGGIGPIPEVLVAEILVPIAFPVVLVHMTRLGKPLLPREGRRYGVAAGALVAVTLFHFVRGPVLDSLSGTLSLGSTGLRPFYDLFVFVGLFFMAVWVLDSIPWDRQSWRSILIALLLGGIVLSVLRLTTITLAIDTPLLTGVFDYGGQARLAGGIPVLRVGGLAESATLGLACLAGLWTMRELKPAVAMTALVWLLMVVALSGGRSLAVGVAFASLFYLLGPARGRRLTVIAGGAVVAAFVVFIAFTYGYGAQFARLASIEGGISAQDPARAKIFEILWGYFLANPLIGKGIGVAAEGLADQFIAAQVVAGGHSSYMSMLGNFGLVGIYFLAVFVLDPLIRSFGRTRTTPSEEIHSLRQGMLTFVLIHTGIKAFEYVAGGSGYGDPSMFLVTALFVIILAKGGADSAASA